MKDDRELMVRCGKEAPFKVPEGYFEHFHECIMDNLPDLEEINTPSAAPVSLMTCVKPWLYMAAMFVSTIFVVQALMYVQDRRFASGGDAIIEELYAEEADHFMSSSLYDEYTLYSYLTTEEDY